MRPKPVRELLRFPDGELGPAACRQCGIRLGLGSCPSCVLRAMRDGADGLDKWIAGVLAYIEADRRTETRYQRLALKSWLKGWNW